VGDLDLGFERTDWQSDGDFLHGPPIGDLAGRIFVVLKVAV